MNIARPLVTTVLCLAAALGASGALCADTSGEAPKYVEPKLTHAAFGDVRIVVPVTSEDPKVWLFKLANIRNGIAAAAAFDGSAAVRVVVYGRGIALVAQKDNEVATLIDGLRRQGVQFEVCNNTLRAMDIDYHTLHDVAESDVVPSGFLEVAWLQRQGYQVDPSN